MKTLSTLLLFLISFVSISQITYEKGYFIDNQSQRTECLIKNYDWKNNPKEIECQVQENAQIQIFTIDSIKEFGIYNQSRYIRAKVNIDRSSTNILNLSTQKEPEWSLEIIFLKILAQGKANLFYFEDRSTLCYSFSVDSSDIQQLIHKEYLDKDQLLVLNNKYREQLWFYVKNKETSIKDVERIDYEKKSLIAYFNKYNKNEGELTVEFGKKGKRDFFDLVILPGINNSKFMISNSVDNSRNTNFGNNITFSFGLETHLILPFNKGKWHLIFQPTYNNFHTTGKFRLGTASLKYNAIELQIGLRYYVYFTKDLKLFLNSFIIPRTSIDFDSQINFDNQFGAPLKMESGQNAAFGVGINYSRFSMEIRYHIKRNLLVKYSSWNSEYQRIGVQVGFRIF